MWKLLVMALGQLKSVDLRLIALRVYAIGAVDAGILDGYR